MGFHKWGYPSSWMVYFMENPSTNGWFGGTPILGNHNMIMMSYMVLYPHYTHWDYHDINWGYIIIYHGIIVPCFIGIWDYNGTIMYNVVYLWRAQGDFLFYEWETHHLGNLFIICTMYKYCLSPLSKAKYVPWDEHGTDVERPRKMIWKWWAFSTSFFLFAKQEGSTPKYWYNGI